MAKIGPYSAPSSMAKIDGRSSEGRFLRRVRAELTAHCGGSPDAAAMMLIDRIAYLRLRIAAMDAKAVGGELTELDSRVYLAWSNSLRRAVSDLGPAVAPVATRPKPFRERLAARQVDTAA